MSAPKENNAISIPGEPLATAEEVDFDSIVAEYEASPNSQTASHPPHPSTLNAIDEQTDPTDRIPSEAVEHHSRPPQNRAPVRNESVDGASPDSPHNEKDSLSASNVDKTDNSCMEDSIDVNFKHGIITQIKRDCSNPNYLGGMKRLVVGRLGYPRDRAWQVTKVIEDDPHLVASLPKGVDILGILIVNRGVNAIPPPLACHDRPCLVIDIHRDQDKGTLLAKCGVLKAGAVLEERRELERQLFSCTMFDEFKQGSLVIRAWRSCWTELWQHTLDNKTVEVSGFLGGRLDPNARTIDVCGFLVDGHGGPHGVTLDRNHLGPADVEFGRKGWRVIGWWHTHPSQGVFLSNLDRQKHFQLFPPPATGSQAKRGWDLAVALVLAPHAHQDSVRGGFFLPVARGSNAVIGERLAEAPFKEQNEIEDWGILQINPPTARPEGHTFLLDPLILREENEGAAFEEEVDSNIFDKRHGGPSSINLKRIAPALALGFLLVATFLSLRKFGPAFINPQKRVSDAMPSTRPFSAAPTREIYQFVLNPDDASPLDIVCKKNRDDTGFWTLGGSKDTRLCLRSMKPHRVEPEGGSDASWGWHGPCPPNLKISLRPTEHLFVAATQYIVGTDWQRWFCGSCPCQVSWVEKTLEQLRYDHYKHHAVEVSYIIPEAPLTEAPSNDLR